MVMVYKIRAKHLAGKHSFVMLLLPVEPIRPKSSNPFPKRLLERMQPVALAPWPVRPSSRVEIAQIMLAPSLELVGPLSKSSLSESNN